MPRMFVLHEASLTALRHAHEHLRDGKYATLLPEVIENVMRDACVSELSASEMEALDSVRRVGAEGPRCPDCGKKLPNDEEIDAHDHRPPLGPCDGCKIFCWRVVNDDRCEVAFPTDDWSTDARRAMEIASTVVPERETLTQAVTDLVGLIRKMGEVSEARAKTIDTLKSQLDERTETIDDLKSQLSDCQSRLDEYVAHARGL